MWKAYSRDYIKHNRTSGISIMAASFIAALFLSFLCSLFYNFWLDNIQGTKLEDGDWHGRITGELSTNDLMELNSYANVERAVINEELSQGQETVADIWFYNKRTVYQDMNSLVNILGLEESAADYNYQLLSLYFIRVPGDEMPRLIMPLYLAVVALVCFSLILVIHNSFAVSMNSRVHQFGIFSSIGATPGQIRSCLIQEALILALAPILAGLLLGFVLSFATVRAMGTFASNQAGGRRIPFGWHPVILMLILLLSLLTVLISAWLPARKLSRLTPLEAIRGTGELQLKKGKLGIFCKHSPILSALFGIEGELAGNALKAQKKALRTTSLSLTFAFLGFMLMQCFFTLSGISTDHTYFERYQDTWDVMVTVKDTRIEEFNAMVEIQGLQESRKTIESQKLLEEQEVPNVRSSTIYQKAEAVCILPAEAISTELLALGDPEAVAGSAVSSEDSSFIIKAPIVILDDESFGEYCGQIGVMPDMSGTILLNRIWDSLNSNFRYREYVPYIQENGNPITLQNASREGEAIEISVLAYTQECPALREEFDDYALVNFIPLSLWKEISGQIGGSEKDLYIRLLANEDVSINELEILEEKVALFVGADYEIESENRIQERISNDSMIKGYEMVLGAFCVLLAVIGIAHMFSSTLGFLHQRRREFARYLSVGLTLEGLRKLFCIEALALAGRPALISLILTVAAVVVMIKASYLNPVEFIAVAPVLPITIFILTVFGFVALAYFLGGKRVLRSDLAEALRDDTMI